MHLKILSFFLRPTLGLNSQFDQELKPCTFMPPREFTEANTATMFKEKNATAAQRCAQINIEERGT